MLNCWFLKFVKFEISLLQFSPCDNFLHIRIFQSFFVLVVGKNSLLLLSLTILMALQPIMIILGIIFMRYFQFAHSFFMWKIILCNIFQEHLDFPVANATIGYLIARPKVQAHKAPQRVCLIYTNLNDTYFWTVDPTSCPRKIKPGVAGIFKFNTTKIGK